MNFELEVGWWDMQSNSSCNRVRIAVVHELVQVVTEDTLVRDQVI